jgi:GNAT superfamily N-acetyltransferase
MTTYSITPGTRADFAFLRPWHPLATAPAVATQIWTLRLSTSRDPLGVLVETCPTLACHLRRVALGTRYDLAPRALGHGLLNHEVRRIARLIVAPGHQSRGFGRALLRHALTHARVPVLELLTHVPAAQRLAAAVGMHRFDPLPRPHGEALRPLLHSCGLAPATLAAPALWAPALARLPIPDQVRLHHALKRFAPWESNYARRVQLAHQYLCARPSYFVALTSLYTETHP